MGLPEPANELYNAVKAISPDLWPPDDENVVSELGRAWRTASDAAKQSAKEVEASRTAVVQAWPDRAGLGFNAKLAGGVRSLTLISQGAAQLAGFADAYRQELVNAKEGITQTIARNLVTYLKLGFQHSGKLGSIMQEMMARKVAGQLNAMIAEKAAALRGAVPVSPAPPPAPTSATTRDSDGDSTAGQVGDFLSIAASVAGVAALVATGPVGWTALGASLVFGAGALAGHGADALADGNVDVNEGITLANDVLGMAPAAKGINAVLGGLATGASKADLLGLGLQVPVAADLYADGESVNETKNVAGEMLLRHNIRSLTRSLP